MSLLKSALTVSGLTLVSRVTGVIRDMLIARFFGASAETDAFYVAFRLPNMLRRLFAEGALAGLRSDARRREGEKRGRGGHLHRPRLHRARAFAWRRKDEASPQVPTGAFRSVSRNDTAETSQLAS